jgi:glutathione S-transferase
MIQDGNVTLAESAAIFEYIYLQPAVLRYGMMLRSGFSSADMSARFAKRAFEQSLQILEDRLKGNKWLAGEGFTAADIRNVFTLTTMRLFSP